MFRWPHAPLMFVFGLLWFAFPGCADDDGGNEDTGDDTSEDIGNGNTPEGAVEGKEGTPAAPEGTEGSAVPEGNEGTGGTEGSEGAEGLEGTEGADPDPFPDPFVPEIPGDIPEYTEDQEIACTVSGPEGSLFIHPGCFQPRICPGQSSCPDNIGILRAGAAKRAITPTLYEVPKMEFLRQEEACADTARNRCGNLIKKYDRDCGNDTLCDDDDGYPGPDADGSEGDGVQDWFHDCGTDRLCPGDDGYPGPDADGTEGNGQYDGLWMAGFDTDIPMTGVHDDTWARSVAIQTGGTTLVVTSLDDIGTFMDDIDRIRALAREKAEKAGIEAADYVIVSSNHIHECPDTMGIWGPTDSISGVPKGGIVKPYLDFVIDQAAQSIVGAMLDLRDAQLRAGSLLIPRGETRPGPDGQTIMGDDGKPVEFLNVRDTRAPKLYDLTMTVLHFADTATGETIATAANWPNHPEILRDNNNDSSADFLGPMRDALENGLDEGVDPALFPKRQGLGGIAVYWQGPVGGLMTPLGIQQVDRFGQRFEAKDGFAIQKAYGENLAEYAFRALDTAKAIELTSGLEIAGKKLLMPVENINFKVVFFALKLFDRVFYNLDPRKQEKFDPANPGAADTNIVHGVTEITTVRLGPITWFTNPGELFPELSAGFDPANAYGEEIVAPDLVNPPDLAKAPKDPPLRELFANEFVIPLGLAHDEIGYIVPPYTFVLSPMAPYLEEAEGDHYEETNSVGSTIWPTLLNQYNEIKKLFDSHF